MIKFTDYIKDCLKNPEFRKYWEEDMMSDLISDDDVFEALEYTYDESALYEDKNQYKQDLDNLILNKRIEANSRGSTTIILYEYNNYCPVADFLNSITDEKLKEKTVKNIYDLQYLGRNAREPLSKYVADGILELRTKQGNNIDRVFYFFFEGNRIILTNDYVKKSEKLAKLEFAKAKKYRDDYYNNRRDDEV